MSIFTTHPALRWTVPSVAALAVVGAGAGSGVLSASADSGLPPRTAAQLLTDVQQARLDGLSGTMVLTSDLGLPALPDVGGGGSGGSGSGSSQLSSLLSGTHTMRLWYAGPDRARMALLGTLGESDVVRNGKDVWVWSSQEKTAAHYTLGAGDTTAAGETHGPGPGWTTGSRNGLSPNSKAGVLAPTDLPTSPQEAADMALKAIRPSTEVTTSGTARVAGRSAYELVLSPRDATSLVSSVRVAIDGEHRVPLRVQVFAKQSVDPVFEVTFSSVDFGRPEASQFVFNPPPGTKVTEVTKDALAELSKNKAGETNGQASHQDSADKPTTVGTGWVTVVVAKAPAELLKPSTGSGSGSGTGGSADQTARELRALLGILPKVSGSWGSGHVLAGKLFSAVLTDDGRIAMGAVTPEALYAALSSR